MKNIKFNVNKAFSIDSLVNIMCKSFINGQEISNNKFINMHSKDSSKEISEATDELWELLANYEDRQDLYTDKDIDKAVDLCEDYLYELRTIWNEAHSKMIDIFDKALSNIDPDCIENCKLKYLGDGIFQLSSENMCNLIKGFEDKVRGVITPVIYEAIINFVNTELDGDLHSTEMRLGEIGQFKITAYTYNKAKDVLYACSKDILAMHLLDNDDLQNSAEGDYRENKYAYFYTPRYISIYDTKETNYRSIELGNTSYWIEGVREYFSDNLMKDEFYSAQIAKLKQTVVNALENADSENVYGLNSIINRAKDLTAMQINSGLVHCINKIGEDFAKEYEEFNESTFTRINKLLDLYRNVPAEVFGNDLIRVCSSTDYNSNKIEVEAIGWNQERIDEMNASLSKLFNEIKNVYESTKDVESKIVEIEIDDFFIHHLTFFELTNRTKAKQYEEVKKILSNTLSGYTLRIENSLVANAFKSEDADFSKYGKIFVRDTK